MNQSPQKDIIIYSSNDGKISFNVNVFNETIWLTQKQMAELFDKSVKTVSEHINNIFEERELEVNSTIRNFRIVQKEGDRDVVRDVEHYNLDAIISVGYRVKSKRGTQFRQWATQILKQYLMNGYVINEPRIRQIESSIDELVKDQKLLKEDVDGIKNLLLKLIERPVIIHNNINNQISLTSSKLEEKNNRIIRSINCSNKIRLRS
ncbi:virulence RhuM family protein [Rickettsiales bacterium]|nr:virulence RhuM family protein [Rickettsiales bacterium]